MAQTKHQIQAILSAAGAEPRQRFGQNFMIDQNLVRLVADAGEIATGDVVIEVGPGTGTLTEELLSRGAQVIAVEIDRDLAAALRERYANELRFELIEGDALAGKHGINPQLLARLNGPHTNENPAAPGSRDAGGARDTSDTHPVKLVANLPYNIASPLVIELLIVGVDLLAFTVQKEVADRLRAGANDDAYGPLSVMAQLLSRVEVLRTLPPQAFWPAPKIASSLVRLRRADRFAGATRAGDFSRFLHQVFSARRKTLRKAIQRADVDEQVLRELDIDPQLRPENLTPEQFLKIFDAARATG